MISWKILICCTLEWSLFINGDFFSQFPFPPPLPSQSSSSSWKKILYKFYPLTWRRDRCLNALLFWKLWHNWHFWNNGGIGLEQGKSSLKNGSFFDYSQVIIFIESSKFFTIFPCFHVGCIEGYISKICKLNFQSNSKCSWENFGFRACNVIAFEQQFWTTKHAHPLKIENHKTLLNFLAKKGAQCSIGLRSPP